MPALRPSAPHVRMRDPDAFALPAAVTAHSGGTLWR